MALARSGGQRACVDGTLSVKHTKSSDLLKDVSNAAVHLLRFSQGLQALAGVVVKQGTGCAISRRKRLTSTQRFWCYLHPSLAVRRRLTLPAPCLATFPARLLMHLHVGQTLLPGCIL